MVSRDSCRPDAKGFSLRANAIARLASPTSFSLSPGSSLDENENSALHGDSASLTCMPPHWPRAWLQDRHGLHAASFAGDRDMRQRFADPHGD
jgi:hypothetical protein